MSADDDAVDGRPREISEQLKWLGWDADAWHRYETACRRHYHSNFEYTMNAEERAQLPGYDANGSEVM